MRVVFKNKPIKQDLHHKTSLYGAYFANQRQIGLFFIENTPCFQTKIKA
jgi:hypothetical protein